MTNFVIDPSIRILGRHGSFVRSTKEAAAFLRENMDVNAPKVLQRMEGVMSVEEAQEAAYIPSIRGNAALWSLSERSGY